MKNENFFMELILSEWSLSDILCSELIHHFLESFYSSDHVTLGGFNAREGVFWLWREIFFSKANKQFQLTKEVHTTCLTFNLPDVSVSRKYIKLNNFICLTYHLPTNLKIRHKFSRTTN